MDTYAFISRWEVNTKSERQVYQQHFTDLCHLVGELAPGQTNSIDYTFEKFARTPLGSHGFADVYRRDCFIVEYKKPNYDLSKAYWQIQKYRDDLGNPPLLITCDTQRLHIHTNFTGQQKEVHKLTLNEFRNGEAQPLIKRMFRRADIEQTFRPNQTAEAATEKAARKFAKLAKSLRDRRLVTGEFTSEESAIFLTRILFCLFAEDIGLLPDEAFTKIIKDEYSNHKIFQKRLSSLFQMMRKGNEYARIPWFNGGLFDEGQLHSPCTTAI